MDAVKLLLAVTVLVLLSLFSPAKALMVPQGFDYTLSPGESRIEVVMLDNEGISEVNVSITKQGGINNFVFLSNNEFSIPSFNSYQLSFYIAVPSETTEGIYTGNLTFMSIDNGTQGVVTRSMTVLVEKTRYVIVSNTWINLGQAFVFGDYKLFPTDVSGHDSCFTKITKNGVEIFNAPITNKYSDINEHLRVMVTESYGGGAIKTCRYTVFGDESSAFQIVDSGESQGTTDGDDEGVTATINLYGSIKPGLPIVFELVNDKGGLLSGRLIITGQTSGTETLQGDGLFNYVVRKDELGPITVMAYHNNKSVAHAIFTIIGGGQTTDQGGSQEDDDILSGKLVIRNLEESILPDEDIVIKLIDDYTGDPVLSADVFINNPCGPDVDAYTNSEGRVIFNPPEDGWCEGTYTIEVRRAGYTPSPMTQSLTVSLPRVGTRVLFYYNNESIDNSITSYPVDVKVVERKSKEEIDFDGYGIMEGPDGNETTIKFISGMASFTPMLNGTYEIEISDAAFDAEEMPYFGSDNEIDVKQYVQVSRGPKFWDYLPWIALMFCVALGLLGFYKLASRGSRKKKPLNRIGYPRVDSLPGSGIVEPVEKEEGG